MVSGPREALARFGGAARVLGTVGGDALRIEGVLDVRARRSSPARTRTGSPTYSGSIYRVKPGKCPAK